MYFLAWTNIDDGSNHLAIDNAEGLVFDDSCINDGNKTKFLAELLAKFILVCGMPGCICTFLVYYTVCTRFTSVYSVAVCPLVA